MYNISPKGTIPVLHLTDDTIIDESLDIMLWVDKKLNDTKLLNTNSKIQLELINENDTTFKYWLDRYKYFDRFPNKTQNHYFNQASKFLNTIEKYLIKNHFIISNKIELVDLAIFPFIRQFSNVNFPLFKSKFQYILNWYLEISESKRFQIIMKKNEFWSNDNKPLLINLYQ